MHIKEIAKPGLMLSQCWPTSGQTEGATLKGLETALKEEYFELYQCVEVPYAAERKAIAQTVKDAGTPLTYCIARHINNHKWNYADLDEANRQRSVDSTLPCLEEALEAGASAMSLISGPAPANPADRPQALEALARSMEALCLRAKELGGLPVVLEPLDYAAHKKNALGTTEEAVALCAGLAEKGLSLTLCIDTAHVVLNEESVADAVALARDCIAEFHFCNCVTDPAHPLFGDRHMPFGAPGIFAPRDVIPMVPYLQEIGFFTKERRGGVFCEVILSNAFPSSEALVRDCRNVLDFTLDEMTRR